VIEERIAAHWKAASAPSLASGQAAETPGHPDWPKSGDHIVSSPSLYGGTYNLFHYTLPKHRHRGAASSPNPDDLDSLAGCRSARTRRPSSARSIANPKSDVLDIEARGRRGP
jgi:O-acetylhomoserine (thiol)-lyase